MKQQPEYITKELAAKRAGKSVRRLLELAATGRIRKKIIQDEKNAGRALSLFHAGDIAALRAGVVPPPAQALQISSPVRQIAAVPHTGPLNGTSVAPAKMRPWLTIAEAADYTGLPESFLLHMIEEGDLPALDVGVRPGGKWRVSRRALDGISAG